MRFGDDEIEVAKAFNVVNGGEGGGGRGMGRMTRSFRRQFDEELETLESGLVRGLRDPGLRMAWEELVEVWGAEQGAMSVSSIPTPLDIMLLIGLLDSRRKIERLEAEIQKLQLRIQALEQTGNDHRDDDEEAGEEAGL